MPEIPTTQVAMPSADLVTFRFDTIDKEMISLHTKLDGLTVNFATRDEVAAIQKRLDSYTWYWRAIVVAVLTAMATAVAALLTKGVR